MGDSDVELDELRTQYDEINREYKDLLRRLEDASETESAELSGQLRQLDSARYGLKAEIEARGGTVGAPAASPADASSPPESSPQEAPSPPEIHLHAPPTGIDQDWNKLVRRYEDALRDAAEHATMKRDDWTCGAFCDDAGNHNQCAIWWDGHTDVVVYYLRDAAHQLLEHLAGPSTQDEIAAGNVVRRIRTQIERVNEDIAAAQARLATLMEQFERDEKTYEYIREEGGDLGMGTGVFTAGRSRLLHDIHQAQKELNKLYAKRHDLFGQLRTDGGADLELRRRRGLERATEGRYGWDGVDLDFDELSDEELLKRLLGDEQYQLMKEETQKQAGQRARQRLDGEKKVSSSGRSPFLRSTPAKLGLGALGVLLLGAAAVTLLPLGGDDNATQPETDVTTQPRNATPPEGETFSSPNGWTIVFVAPTDVVAGEGIIVEWCAFDPSGAPAEGTAQGSAGPDGDYTSQDASHGSAPFVDGCASIELSNDVPAGGTIGIAGFFEDASSTPMELHRTQVQ